VVRAPKGVRLALAGELLVARATTVLREVTRAREQVAWFARNARTTATVGVSPAAALLLVPGALARFQGRWPALPVRPAAPGARAHDPAAFNDAVRGAVGALVPEGLVDRDRVGILGFNATGEQVLNLVTFTDVPVRAATLIDGDANTLFSPAVTYAGSDNFTAKKEARNGGLPLGDTRLNWMRSGPSLPPTASARRCASSRMGPGC
jgi:hypothetical protein